MSERPSAGIGKRLAKYRKLASLSARELSEKVGGELSRGVIANIESGRKTDVTIDQLLSLSWALGIPPVLLALPVDQPLKFVRVIDSGEETQASRSYRLMSWFLNERSGVPGTYGSGFADTAAGALGQELINAIRAYPKMLSEVREGREDRPDDEDTQVRELELKYHERFLRQLGADTHVFHIDE